MIRLLIVADGPRDEATLPPLVETIVGKSIGAQFVPWRGLRVHSPGKGNRTGRKLKFAVRRAQSDNLEGVVAVVDRDRDEDRLRDLTDARADDRAGGVNLPTAVGCAVPHSEKWYVSDRTAMKVCFPGGTDADFEAIQRSRKPKDDLDGLFAAHDVPKIEGLRILSSNLQVSRCAHRDDSGLSAFEADLIAEIGPI
jgi:hypothetical protein